MQVIKPQALSLSTRPIEFRKRFGLSVSACLHIPFAQLPRGTLWAEQSMWAFLAQEMAQPMIDEGVAKLTAEYLVHGRAYAPTEQPNGCAVRARFGALEKTLLVFGERHWDGARVSEPHPFVQMPLDWAHAYGGTDFTANPAGRGRQALNGLVWLPNIESPHQRLLRPDQGVEPAGFGALEPMHPQRVQYRGTYDADYLKLHAPGFAPDTDWRYFNLASPDQWIADGIVGDEAFSFEHMHPDQPSVGGRLPGLRARVFAGYRDAKLEAPRLREVPLRCTTLWFFPHAERCIAIFQGLAEVETDDGSDVLSLLGAVERIGERRPDEHYSSVIAKRADPRMGPVYALLDSDLLPDGLSTLDPEVERAKAPFSSAGLQAEVQYRRAAMDVAFAQDRAVAAGQDPEALGLRIPPREKVPVGDELVPYLEKQIKVQEAAQWAAVEDMVSVMERALEVSDKYGINIAKLQHRGPPKFNAEVQWAELRKLLPGEAESSGPSPMFRKLCALEEANRAGYLQAAHQQAPVDPMPATAAQALREEMRRAVAAGITYFAGADFTGADFAGLDLRGVNLSEAWLESANLSGANLSGANFSSAVLAHANLEGAIAVGTCFAKANLGKARLSRAVLDEADFTDAMLMGCRFASLQARRAVFRNANLLETMWSEADCSEANLAGQTFYKLDLRGVHWVGADLSACNFIESDLSGVNMSGADLRGATFATCRLDGARLMAARCQGAVAVKESSLAAADLSDADLSNFNFGASSLEGVKLVRAVLDGANLCDARMRGADLRLASAKGVLMRKAACPQALLSGVNFSDAILQSADLRGADLRRSNFFGADLSRVRLDGDTRLDGAVLERARTWPRLTAEQQAAP